MACLERRFAEDNRSLARKYLRGGETERTQRRVERNVGRLEERVGELSRAQVQRVARYSERAHAAPRPARRAGDLRTLARR